MSLSELSRQLHRDDSCPTRSRNEAGAAVSAIVNSFGAERVVRFPSVCFSHEIGRFKGRLRPGRRCTNSRVREVNDTGGPSHPIRKEAGQQPRTSLEQLQARFPRLPPCRFSLFKKHVYETTGEKTARAEPKGDFSEEPYIRKSRQKRTKRQKSINLIIKSGCKKKKKKDTFRQCRG